MSEPEAITVKVRSIALLKTLLGQGGIDVILPSGAEVEDLLSLLIERSEGRLAPHFAEPAEKSAHAPLRVMVNGRDTAVLGGRQTVLKNGDEVLIMIPIAGG
jgi:molybdopterin converting factor small subunit